MVKFLSCMQTCCILHDFGVLVSGVTCNHRKPWKFFITVDCEEADFGVFALLAKLQGDEWKVEETENYCFCREEASGIDPCW